MTDGAGGAGDRSAGRPDMSRERARTERRDLDLERGEPLADSALRGGPRRCALMPACCRPGRPGRDPDHQRRRGRVARAARAQAGARPDRRHDRRRAGHEPERGRPPEDAHATASCPRAHAGRRLARLFGRRLTHRCREPRVPRLLRPGLDLVASGINYGANLGDDITYSGTVSAAMESVINGCPAFAISQEYYEHPDFTLSAMAAAVVARNISSTAGARRADQRQCPGGRPERARRLRGHAARQARLPGRAHPARGPA